MTGVIVVSTVFALYASDIYEATGPPPIESDRTLYAFSFAVFLIFALEFIVLCVCKDGFLLSFFFFLDFLALISLIPDALLLFDIVVISSSSLSLARAGRAARAGTRYSPIATRMLSKQSCSNCPSGQADRHCEEIDRREEGR